MHEIKAKLEEVSGLIDVGLKNIDIPTRKVTLSKFNEELMSPDLWDNRENAQELTQKAAHLTKLIETWEGMRAEAD
ncbi:MAG: hypothetical protein WCX95_04275, partial [Candidatus Gracilibacteria bacterium]